ncbi:MAG: lipid II flippase MurJ, partial [Clostridia bacterium]|nr:lipid II flippase MurJ [Clostridia bacterium]
VEVEKSEDTNCFVNNVINMVLLFCILIVVIGFLNIDTILKIFAIGFDVKTMNLARSFTYVSILAVFFISLTNVFMAVLQLNYQFKQTAAIGIPFSIIIMISIVLASKVNIMYLPFGTLLAYFTQFVILLMSAYRVGFRYKPILRFNDKYLRALVKMGIPVIIGTSTTQINQIVDKTIASSVAIGAITTLSYAHRIDTLVQSVFITVMTTLLFPRITRLASENKMMEFKNKITESIIGINIFVIPAVVGLIILSRPIIVLYLKGEHLIKLQ